jgi:hypothetical protein
MLTDQELQTLRNLGNEAEAAADEIARLRAALVRIARWHGEFPATGKFWDAPENTQPMSYSAAFGSKGERDFMRQIALDALRLNVLAERPQTAQQD